MAKNRSSVSQNESLVRTRARKRLVDFSIATNPKYEPNWHHDYIAKELENLENADYQILILQLPPRHGKSEEASINYPAWYLGNNPDKEIITASYSAELALDFGSKTRDLINSEEYQDIFNIKLRQDEKSKAKWRTEKGGSYTSVGIGGPITGRGANRLIIDDPIKNREEADSQVIREKHWSWFTSTAYTRLEPNGKIIIILTRWHLDDLAGRILENDEFRQVTKVVNFPAIAIEDEKHRKKGEALWPSRYDLESLESTKRKIGLYDWAALYQQNPVLSENQEFKTEWFKVISQEEVDRLFTRNFLTVDTAISEKASADYTGICDNSVDKDNFWYLKAWRLRVNPKDLIDLLFTLHDKRNYEKIGIEKTIYYQAIKPFLDEECRRRGRFLPVVELEHNQTQKETRIRGLIPRYSTGSVYHIKNECLDLQEELLNFPRAINDDVSDSTAYQLQIAEPMSPNKNMFSSPKPNFK